MPLIEGICWTATGDGPVVMVPRLNVDWTAVDLSALTGMGNRTRARNEAARSDPATWAEVLATYDPGADIAALPRHALVDLACPVRADWFAACLRSGTPRSSIS